VEAFLTSLGIVVLAEMGDKTQLLAMAFAARFRWQTVLLAVFAATAANHLLAVLAGCYLATLCQMECVKAAAAASFILFGLWTLRGDTLHGEDKRFSLGPFWTVAIAFFIAEIGDKTQLCTVALAAEFNTVIPVWAGTTLAMIIADAIGIIVGVAIHKKIPARLVKWIAAVVFILFGLWGLYEVAPASMLTVPLIAGVLVLIVGLGYLVIRLGAVREVPAEPAHAPAGEE
jgi:putative Ca2+/H+ antiporter (TMEM165/GDT1 family)